MKRLLVVAAVLFTCAAAPEEPKPKPYHLLFVDESEDKKQWFACHRPSPEANVMVCGDLEPFLIEILSKEGKSTPSTTEM